MEVTSPTTPVAPATPTQPPLPPPPSATIEMPATKGGKKKIIILGIIACLTLLVGISFFVFLTKGGYENSIIVPTITPAEINPTLTQAPDPNVKFKELRVEIKNGQNVTVDELGLGILFEENEIVIPDCFDCAKSSRITLSHNQLDKWLFLA